MLLDSAHKASEAMQATVGGVETPYHIWDPSTPSGSIAGRHTKPPKPQPERDSEDKSSSLGTQAPRCMHYNDKTCNASPMRAKTCQCTWFPSAHKIHMFPCEASPK